MKDYYQILEIQPTATIQDIKNAYRRLAKVYHPDKNPDEDIDSEKFSLIHEAYSILSDPEQKKEYDHYRNLYLLTDTDYYTPHQRLRSIRIRRIRLQRMRKSSVNYKKYYRYTRLICWIIAIITDLLILDILLPERHRQEIILYRKQSRVSENTAIIYTVSGNFPVDEKAYPGYLSRTNRIKISITPIFKTVLKVEFRYYDVIKIIEPYYSIYSYFVFIIIILFLCSHIALFLLPADYEFTFNAAFVCSFFFGLLLVIMFATH